MENSITRNGMRYRFNAERSNIEAGQYAYFVGEHCYFDIEILNYSASEPKGIFINDALYYEDSKGKLYLDFTDELRTLGNNAEWVLKIKLNEQTAQEDTINFLVFEGVNPYDWAVLAPVYAKNVYCGNNSRAIRYLPLPNVILRSKEPFLENIVLPYLFSVDMYKRAEKHIDITTYNGTEEIMIDSAYYAIDTPSDTNAIRVRHSGEEYVQLEKKDNCVLVEWDCAYGNVTYLDTEVRARPIKRALFELMSGQLEAKAIELMATKNGYNQSKAKSQTLTLKLRGLDSYSLWWYSDIILSNKIKIAVSEYDRPMEDVEITNTKTSYNYGSGNLYDLELNVKYKNYD